MDRGLYERIIDQGLAEELERLEARVQSEKLDESDSHQILAEHLGDLIAAVLRRQPSDKRLAG